MPASACGGVSSQRDSQAFTTRQTGKWTRNRLNEIPPR
jgi:hypothetical protein